ncbi:MAG TPA: recombination mediator RecR [Aggregatilineales bacterium]|nr:recombination protein RecR [Anaerolineales bacterium]HRE47843.1 recombination mediator RecR [Aggregatilineales bacterium]
MSKAIPESVTRLIDSFSRLPGIGPKTASRLTYFLLRSPEDLASALSTAITDLKAKTRLCKVCFNITEDETCPICTDERRDGKLVAVVEEPLDVLALERAGVFQGRYHVLHGVLSPREGIFAENLKIKELIGRVKEGMITEIILATNPGMEGDATAQFIRDELGRASLTVKVTRLARGLSTGSDLEHADAATLMRALEGRQNL